MRCCKRSRTVKRLKTREKRVFTGAVDVRERNLNPAFKGATVVNVSAVPLTMRERSYDPVIERVYRLPPGQGLKCPCGGVPRAVAEGRQIHLAQTGKRLGMPIVTRLRCIDKLGYVIYLFKRRDMTKRRHGRETR